MKLKSNSNLNLPLDKVVAAVDPLDEFATQWAAKTPAEKETQLRTLARDGELTDSLISMMSGTDLDCVDSYGWTPLFEGDPPLKYR